jgi:ribosomal protein S18 acetylase RimI-like enzyme
VAYKIKLMTLNKYDELIAFWKSIDGVWVSDDDSYENMKTYFKRNSKTNFVAVHNDKIIGTVKCSHDGRRGYLHHVAVKEEFRNQGIAKEMVEKCINILRKEGIKQFRLFVLDSNKQAQEFWKHLGFTEDAYDYRTFRKSY